MKYICTILIYFMASRLLLSFDFESKKSQYGFIENNGQVYQQNYMPNPNVKYILNRNNINLALNQNSFSYEIFESIDSKSSFNFSVNDIIINDINFKIHRIDATFLYCNENFEILPDGKYPDYINYYNLKNLDTDFIACNHFKKITYKNIYNNIDIIFYSSSDNHEIKYDIIVHPGADINDIQIKIDGAENINIIDDKLYIKTSIKDIVETIPKSYDEDGNSIKVQYRLSSNILSFSTDNYNQNKTLTIDPLLNYGTYFGGSGNDVGLEISTDTGNNIIITGFTTSLNNIATSGAYQTEMKGDHDAFLVRYSSNGSRLWSTYFGGSGYDTGHGVATDKNGNIAMVGWTNSISNISTSGAHQIYYSGGDFDSYIAKFNPSGNLQWSTYYGGPLEDYINDVVIDGYSDIVLIGRTSSSVNFATLNSFQNFMAGNNDAFIAKFSTNGIRKWGTYFGGNGFDIGMEVSTDIFNNIAVTGFTQSSSGIASPNAFKTNLSGIWDAFIAKFSKDGNRIWSSYFGGSQEDNGRGVDFDGDGNIYITGNTFSTDSIATIGAYQEDISSAESEVFITKFNSNGNLSWSTYYGGEDDDFGNVAAIDPWNQITIAGITSSIDNISTPNEYKTSHTGMIDVFISSFLPNGNINFGTYYGGYANDYSHGIAFNKKAEILLTGYTRSVSEISTSNADQEESGGFDDTFVAKFANTIPPDSIFISNVNGVWCADNILMIPYTEDGDFSTTNKFTAQLSNASGLFIDFYNIGEITSNQSGTITAHIPKEAISGTNYRIRIVSSDPKVISPDNGIDITINELPKPSITGEQNLCNGSEYLYMANKGFGIEYNWSAENATITGNNNQDTVNVVWDTVGVGSLKLIETNSQSGCKDSIIMDVTIYPKIIASHILSDTKVCPKTDVIYSCSNDNFISNEWTITNGQIKKVISKDSISVIWDEDEFGTISLIQTSLQSNCRDTNSMNIELYNLPKPVINGSTNVIAFQMSTYRTQSNSRYFISWKVVGGKIINSSTSNVIDVMWDAPGRGSVMLLLVDKETSCQDSLLIITNIRLDASEIIIGDSIVCAYTSIKYLFSDDNYNKKWLVEGGMLDSPDSLDEVIVFWEAPGIGQLRLIRTHKVNLSIDTIDLDIKILNLPEGRIYGNNEICESITDFFITDANEKYLRRWIAFRGKILGSDTNDSVLVEWDKLQDDIDSNFIVGRLVLMLYDTTTGCIHNIQKNIFINSNPEVDIIGENEVCRDMIYSYSTQKDENSQIIWDVQGGIITNNMADTTIVVKWQATDSGLISINETSIFGCSDSIFVPITILNTPSKPLITQKGKQLFSSSDENNQWFLDGNEIPDANNKIFTPLISGIYTLQITGSSGCKSPVSNPYYFDINNIIDKNYEKNIVIFPNPSKELVNININPDIYNIVNVQIYNLVGNKLFDNEYKLNNSNISIELNYYSSGVYIIVFTLDGENKYYRRIVKY